MTLDMSKILKTKAALTERMSKASGSNFTKVLFWKPNKGKNTIRIMPPSWAPDSPFAGQFWREVHQHWNVAENQNGPVICPAKTPHSAGGDCPICKFVEELKADKTNVQAQEMVKDIRAKVAYLVNIVDLNDPVYTAKDVAEATKENPDAEVPFNVGDPKIQVYAATTSVFSLILGIIQDNELDITNLKTGNDLFLTKNGEKLTTKYEVSLKVKSSVSDVPEDANFPDLGAVGINLDSEKLMDLLSTGVGGAHVASLPSGTKTTALPANTSKAPSKPKKEVVNDVEDLEASLHAALRGN
jgi:hypothetical protein